MRTRTSAWVSLLAVATGLALLVLSAGPAVADHAYSHRYVVSGRVVDQIGDPVKDVSVTVTPPASMVSTGPCTLDPVSRSTTDGWGDYYYCFHIHTFPAEGSIAIQAGGLSFTAAPDTKLRKSVQNIQLLTTEPGTRKDLSVTGVFDSTYTVRGRVWQPQVGAVVETIPVEGVALENYGVHNVLTSNAGRQEQRAVTNNYGDYSARFSMGSTVSSGEVSVTAGPKTVVASVNTIFRVSDVDLVVPPPNPIADALAAGWPFIVALAILVAVAFVAIRYAPKRSRIPDVSKVPGIGRAKAAQLRRTGIATVAQLAEATSKGIAETTSISQKEAKRLIRKARDMLATRAQAEAAESGD